MLGLFNLGGGEILLLLTMLLFVPLGLALFAFWIWMLIDAIRNPGLTDTEKIVWVLVILFVHAVGALIYFFAGRNRAKAPAVT